MPDSHVHLSRLDVLRTLVRFLEEWDTLYPVLAGARSTDERLTIISDALAVSKDLAGTALDLQVRKLFAIDELREDLEHTEAQGLH